MLFSLVPRIACPRARIHSAIFIQITESASYLKELVKSWSKCNAENQNYFYLLIANLYDSFEVV